MVAARGQRCDCVLFSMRTQSDTQSRQNYRVIVHIFLGVTHPHDTQSLLWVCRVSGFSLYAHRACLMVKLAQLPALAEKRADEASESEQNL